MTVSLDAVYNTNQCQAESESVSQLQKLLCDTKNCSMPERFRALFALKGLGTDEAVDAIASAFVDSSALLKHELAYVLGQMKRRHAIPHLEKVLANTKEDPMVRHEAAEALGAIGDPETLAILEEFHKDSEVVVSETCQLAIAKIAYEQRTHAPNAPKTPSGPYLSIDPAPPLNSDLCNEGIGAKELQSILMDASLPLFDRYRAMFSLRNMGTLEAVEALATGFKDSSALFRHEIAYVFGQLQHPKSIEPLRQVLENQNELGMVRHEAAEALGSIATEECKPILAKYVKDSDAVVRESCQVGLDMWELEHNATLGLC